MTTLSWSFTGASWDNSAVTALGWNTDYYLTHLDTDLTSIRPTSDDPDQRISLYSMEYTLPLGSMVSDAIDWSATVDFDGGVNVDDTVLWAWDEIAVGTVTWSKWMAFRYATHAFPTNNTITMWRITDWTGGMLTGQFFGDSNPRRRLVIQPNTGYTLWRPRYWNGSGFSNHMDTVLMAPDNLQLRKIRWSAGYGGVILEEGSMRTRLDEIGFSYSVAGSKTYYDPNMSGYVGPQFTQFARRAA